MTVNCFFFAQKNKNASIVAESIARYHNNSAAWAVVCFVSLFFFLVRSAFLLFFFFCLRFIFFAFRSFVLLFRGFCLRLLSNASPMYTKKRNIRNDTPPPNQPIRHRETALLNSKGKTNRKGHRTQSKQRERTTPNCAPIFFFFFSIFIFLFFSSSTCSSN